MDRVDEGLKPACVTKSEAPDPRRERFARLHMAEPLDGDDVAP